jgi:hypothetical protein
MTAAGPRLRRRVYFSLAMFAVTAVCFYLISQQSDSWLGLPAVVGYVVFQSLVLFAVIRRHLRAARQGELIAKKTRYTADDLILYAAAFSLVAACLFVNHRQRAAEFARREAIDELVAIYLGPDGSVTRDHRGRLQLTVLDPTFDDKRLSEVAKLVEEDNRRLGVSVLILSPHGETGPGITDDSVPTLLGWKSLRMVSIHGAAISEEGALRVASLPELYNFWISDVEYGPEAIESLELKFPRFRAMREIEAATKSPPPPVDASQLPPILG